MRKIKDPVAFIRSTRPKLTIAGLAAVFGVSKSTAQTWIQKGKLDSIPKVKSLGGWLYDMEGVFQAAYPSADSGAIARLMAEFRQRERSRRFIR